jgi:hypothetical protein
LNDPPESISARPVAVDDDVGTALGAALINDDTVPKRGGKEHNGSSEETRESVSHLSSVGLDAAADGEASWLHW